MPTSIKIENDIIFISVTGECPLNELNSTQLKASTISKEQNINRIFVDLSQACLDLKTYQLFEINKSHIDLFPLGTKHALIISQTTGKPGDEKFVENVAVNRGVMLKTFVDFENAMEWLKK